MRTLPLLAAIACAILATGATGCASGTNHPTTNAGPATYGDYPAKTSLTPEAVVRTYVNALDQRDGQTYCSVVAHWISGEFDIGGSDPESSFGRPLKCPELVHGFIGYSDDCCPPEFIGARVNHLGPAENDGALFRVPFTVALEQKENDVERTEKLDDVVWLVRENGAWRIASPSRVSYAASIGIDSEPDFKVAPDVAKLRAKFDADRDELEHRLAAREASYLPIGDAVSCDDGATVSDPTSDVADYQHPAPPTPTPQPQYADLTSATIAPDSKSICMRWETAGAIRLPTTFVAYVNTHDNGRFVGQKFEIEARSDGKARIVGGLDEERHEVTLPGRFGISGDAASLVVDEKTFAVARDQMETPYRPVFSLGTEHFAFAFGVTVRLSPQRLLHDDLGKEPATRYRYPGGQPCPDLC